MTNKRFTRRRLLATGLVGAAAAAALAGCGEAQIITETKIQEVVKEVPVEKVVTQIVEKEVVVEKVVTQIVEKEVVVIQEKIVEKLITAAPAAPSALTIEVSFPANNPANVDYINDVNTRYMALNPHITVVSEQRIRSMG